MRRRAHEYVPHFFGALERLRATQSVFTLDPGVWLYILLKKLTIFALFVWRTREARAFFIACHCKIRRLLLIS